MDNDKLSEWAKSERERMKRTIGHKYRASEFTELFDETTGEPTSILAKLHNSEIGPNYFVIPAESQLAMRVKYYVINGNKNYLEDGLVGLKDGKLVHLEDFIERDVNLSASGSVVKAFVHNSLL